MYEVAYLWNEYTSQYATLRLSWQSDLLPAIRGLANQLKSRHTGRYLAGLWEDTLLRDLCWFNGESENLEGGENVDDRPETWRAPTWSWASVNSEHISNFAYCIEEKHSTPIASVLGVETVPLDPGPNDNLLSGIITLRGLVVSAKLKYTTSRHFRFNRMCRDYQLDMLGSGEAWGLCMFWADYDLQNAKDESRRIREGELLQCIQLLSLTEDEKKEHWMVVRRSLDDLNLCERVGMAHWYERDLRRIRGRGKELEIRVR